MFGFGIQSLLNLRKTKQSFTACYVGRQAGSYEETLILKKIPFALKIEMAYIPEGMIYISQLNSASSWKRLSGLRY